VDDERVPAFAKRADVEVCLNLRVNCDHVLEYGGVVPIPIFFPNPVPNPAGFGIGIPSDTSTGSGPGLKSLLKAG
jgi:hypothetical protein